MEKLTKQQAIICEIVNALIGTLGSMPAKDADEVVKRQAERLMNEVAGIKGSVQGNWGCIVFRSGNSKGETTYRFVEE